VIPKDTTPGWATPGWEGIIAALASFYHDVDQLAYRLGAIHADRLQCRCGCHDCCVDAVTVFTVEARHIQKWYDKLLKDEIAHPSGACAFLDAAGACRIYPHRPYVCRTQGLPLRWLAEQHAGERVEMRDICPLNETGPPVESLDPDSCWTIGPFEQRLADLQRTQCGNLDRVPLRKLFLP